MHPLDDPQKEVELIIAMLDLMRENHAPEEQFERLGLPIQGEMTMEMLMEQRSREQEIRYPDF